MRVMYDSITLGEIPPHAQAVAGYVGGRWPTFSELVKDWPHAEHLSIAIGLDEDADALDIEQGDVDPTDLEGVEIWVDKQLRRGVWKPVLYSSQANMGAIIRHLESKGIRRNRFRVWSAHYGFAHICSPHTCRLPDGQPCDFTADGTQWTSSALSRNLDESLLHDDFFHAPAPPPRKSPKKPVKKVTAAGLGGALTTAILAAVHAAGLTLTPAEAGAITSVAAVLSGYVKKA